MSEATYNVRIHVTKLRNIPISKLLEIIKNAKYEEAGKEYPIGELTMSAPLECNLYVYDLDELK